MTIDDIMEDLQGMESGDDQHLVIVAYGDRVVASRKCSDDYIIQVLNTAFADLSGEETLQ